MGWVVDLRGATGPAVLTTTEAPGLFGGAYLAGEPLAERLWPDERVRFVLRNEDRGLRVRGEDGVDGVTPAAAYQALAVVTDLRLLVVAGREPDDRSHSVQWRDVVEARRVDGPGGTAALGLETLGGVRYRFPTRGDLAPVVEHVDEVVGT